MQLIPLDDFDDPVAGACGGQCRTWPLISGVGEDAKDEGPHGTCAWAQHKRCAVAILNIGGVNGNAQQEAERVDENVPLAARDLFAGVIALRIEQSPPFGAALALWLSMIAAVGLASRPFCSRTAT